MINTSKKEKKTIVNTKIKVKHSLTGELTRSIVDSLVDSLVDNNLLIPNNEYIQKFVTVVSESIDKLFESINQEEDDGYTKH